MEEIILLFNFEIIKDVEEAAESVNITVKFPQTTTGTVSITVISIVGACAIIMLEWFFIRTLNVSISNIKYKNEL
jgi:small-conductance mechanosensitive channel